MAEARSFACPSCGSALAIRGLENTALVVCGQCGAAIDAKDPNLKVLAKYRSNAKYQPLIPLGSRGKLRGADLECIGFLRREVVIERVPYRWSEYLLFNPYTGFRWLTESQGHWALVETVRELPQVAGAARHGGKTYKHFQKAWADVVYVLGEFPWRVTVGEEASIDDYVCPPFVLSREKSKDETVWSHGEHLEPREVWEGFKITGLPPGRKGVGACQPNPHRGLGTLFLVFAGLALLVQIATASLSQKKRVFSGSYDYAAQSENAKVTEPFELTGRTSNVGIRISTNLNNAWAYFSLALINEKTGKALDFGRSVSYYHGYDDGHWSEGSARDEVYLGNIQAGIYSLRIEPESDPGKTFRYGVEVWRDVPRWNLFWLALLLLALPALVQWIRWYRFESARWEESDHPWGGGDDDE